MPVNDVCLDFEFETCLKLFVSCIQNIVNAAFYSSGVIMGLMSYRKSFMFCRSVNGTRRTLLIIRSCCILHVFMQMINVNSLFQKINILTFTFHNRLKKGLRPFYGQSLQDRNGACGVLQSLRRLLKPLHGTVLLLRAMSQRRMSHFMIKNACVLSSSMGY